MERESALLGWHEREVLIRGNHRDMVRFASAEDHNYIRISGIIREIISDKIEGTMRERNDRRMCMVFARNFGSEVK